MSSSKHKGINGTLVYENEDVELIPSFVQRGSLLISNFMKMFECVLMFLKVN